MEEYKIIFNQILIDCTKKSFWPHCAPPPFRAKKYSQGVNTNLCPYFEWFGWPLTSDTKDVCDSLPSIPISTLLG